MVSGKPTWKDCDAGTLFQIGFSDELSKFPAQLLDSCRDFLKTCLRRKPTERWSCDHLLQHPFISFSSPNYITEAFLRSVLNYFNFNDDDDEETELNPNPAPKNSVFAHDRIRKLASNRGPIWESKDWMNVRTWISDRAKATTASYCGDEGEGINSAYSNFIGKTEESEKTFAEYPSKKKKLNSKKS
ncbi:hypothetical protein PVL29_001261 [Vitis rotundifolia]|uniref:Protein kinase domain-containing protein n=1 Tax=Vitis rotundifolia TaxID=103349 RepID=A0AA39AL58_VITRO|nr:hypothetical protein PVL29_001261 [Vitis rotundifolia]